jgi:uncharacterized protein (TIGR02679 family)
MSHVDPAGLDRTELTPLWAAARLRLERAGLTFGSTPLVLRDLSRAEREAVGGLVGRRWAGTAPVRVDLTRLDEQLQLARGFGIVELLEALGGPLRDRSDERQQANAAKLAGWTAAFEHPACARHSGLTEWLEGLKRTGRLSRLDTTDQFVVLAATLDAVARLPSEPVQLAVFATRTTGDAHALDIDRPLGVLVGEAVTAISRERDRRASWRALGVELDAVSASVLTLGLRGHPVADAATDEGEPLRLTWRMVANAPIISPAPCVFVCENPAIVDAAATELRTSCAPLICTDGMPGGIVWTLLDRLRVSGVQLLVHADFDVGGVRIAATVMHRCDAAPWRYDAAAYEAARSGPSSDLIGSVAVTPWDPALRGAMVTHRRAVHEEAIIDVLLGDLA